LIIHYTKFIFGAPSVITEDITVIKPPTIIIPYRIAMISKNVT